MSGVTETACVIQFFKVRYFLDRVTGSGERGASRQAQVGQFICPHCVQSVLHLFFFKLGSLPSCRKTTYLGHTSWIWVDKVPYRVEVVALFSVESRTDLKVCFSSVGRTPRNAFLNYVWVLRTPGACILSRLCRSHRRFICD